MADRIKSWLEHIERARADSGLGTCCAEAQADGVPCTILGRDCAICERAVANAEMLGVALWPNKRTESITKPESK